MAIGFGLANCILIEGELSPSAWVKEVKFRILEYSNAGPNPTKILSASVYSSLEFKPFVRFKMVTCLEVDNQIKFLGRVN